MAFTTLLPSLLITIVLCILRVVLAMELVSRDGSSPSLTFDPNTTPYCTWWINLDIAKTCSFILSDNGITLDAFLRWNPSLPASCGTLQAGHSYCVEAAFEPIQSTTTTPKTTSTFKTSTTTSPATTTKPSNGIATPSPVQPNIVTNCDAFYLVKQGDTCDNIAKAHGITAAQFLAWNPSAGSTCGGLWANAFACVSIIGVDPPKTTTTTTKPGNGVTTPVPTQTGMVSSCNKFHLVQQGETCATLASKYSISTAQFIQWNPAAKSDCTGLWTNTYACVGIIGGTTTTKKTTTTPTTTKKTSTTTTKNGISTPTPTQPGMVNNCKKFLLVKSGDTCEKIAKASNVTLDNFIKWNTGVGGKACTSLWANSYVCVGI